MMSKSVLALVDTFRNCEDIAMQFLIANMTNLPHIYIKGHLTDLGGIGGISTSHSVVSAGHMGVRSRCLNDLVSEYGKNPLVFAHTFVDSASNWWSSAPSTWLEYISSDLWRF